LFLLPFRPSSTAFLSCLLCFLFVIPCSTHHSPFFLSLPFKLLCPILASYRDLSAFLFRFERLLQSARMVCAGTRRELLGHVTVLVFLLLPFFSAASGTIGALPPPPQHVNTSPPVTTHVTCLQRFPASSMVTS
jgi:hypothetical protein